VDLSDNKTDPSPDSAGYDLNKIIRTEYDEPLYAEMGESIHSIMVSVLTKYIALEAIQAWRDPLWKGIFHETGNISC